MSKLTAEQRERAWNAFKYGDANHDGKLTVDEFTAALKPYLTDEDLEALLKEVNPDGDDEISWQEFLEDYENDL